MMAADSNVTIPVFDKEYGSVKVAIIGQAEISASDEEHAKRTIEIALPVPTWYKDGGTVKYTSITYSVTKQHSISSQGRGYDVGTRIRVFFDSVTFKEYIIFYNNSRYCGGKLKAYNIKWLS